jgi:YggT family protein
MSYLANAASFLIGLLFSCLIYLFLVRMQLIAVGASFYEPVCQFVYQLTNPVITPLRRIVPRWGRIELASLLVAYLLVLIEFGASALLFGAAFRLPGVLLTALVTLLDRLIWIELVALFVRGLLSWIVSEYRNSNLALLARFTDPIVRPFRRLVPPLAGVDFSLAVAMIALILARMLIVEPLFALAAHL